MKNLIPAAVVLLLSITAHADESGSCALNIDGVTEGDVVVFTAEGKRAGSVPRSAIAGQPVSGCNEDLGLVRVVKKGESDAQAIWVNRSLARSTVAASDANKPTCIASATSREPGDRPAVSSGVASRSCK